MLSNMEHKDEFVESAQSGSLVFSRGRVRVRYAIAKNKQEPTFTLVAAEARNPLRLEPEALGARMTLAFDQCLACLYHYPEVWQAYGAWLSKHLGDSERAVEVLKRGAEALPDCLMLHFAAADLEEAAGRKENARAVLQALARFPEAPAAAPGAEAPPVAPEEANRLAMAWIQYLRFVRRSDGKAESRKVFARQVAKAPQCPHQVFAAAALMEWHFEKDEKIAKNIFELGLKKFIAEPWPVVVAPFQSTSSPIECIIRRRAPSSEALG